MMRFSRKTFTIVNNLLKQNCNGVANYKKYLALVKVPLSYVQHAHYSSDSKSIKSPLSNLINKDATEKNQEKTNEDEARKQREQSWRTMKLTLAFFGISFTCLGGYLVFTLGVPQIDADGAVIEDEFSDKPLILQYILRTYRELNYYKKLIKEPSREKLLPDPLKYPYLQPKYTLVLELTDVLVHPDWTYRTGWRFKKRPMLDYFLETLHGTYEIVIYTAEQGMTVFPLTEAIDPKNLIAYKLVRDATHFSGGHHVKSLSKLNRDLSKVICIDWNAKNVKFNPENLFQIKRWDGRDEDAELADLAAFLKTIAENDIEDVREVLKFYSSFEDPLQAFREKQKEFFEELEAQKIARTTQGESKVSKWSPSFLNRKFF